MTVIEPCTEHTDCKGVQRMPGLVLHIRGEYAIPSPYAMPFSYGLCPVPPERCEWNHGEPDWCTLMQDYEPGHHMMCTFHGEVWLHRAAQEW